jgi:hypothetical protein
MGRRPSVCYRSGDLSKWKLEVSGGCPVVEKQQWWWIPAMVRQRLCDRMWAFVLICMILGIVILGLLDSTLAGLLHTPGWHSRKFRPGPPEDLCTYRLNERGGH